MLLQTRNLAYNHAADVALRFPDIDLPESGELLVTGPSGCGKTTLLHLIAGLLRPKGGEVLVSGQSLGKLSRSTLDRYRGQHIGIVFQQPHFVRAVSLRENLQTAAWCAGRRIDGGRIHELAERLGFAHRLNHRPHRLSQGERQRAGIARALINKPALLLADEPTSSLDDAHAKNVLDLLQQEAAAIGASLLIVTHDRRVRERVERRVDLTPQPAAP